MAKINRSKFKATPISVLALSLLDGDAFYKEKFFEDYIYSVEGFLETEKKEMEKNFDEAAKKNPGDDVFDWFEDDVIKHRDFFPSLLYHSVFVSLTSYFEASLQTMCKYVAAKPVYKRDQKYLDKYQIALEPYFDMTSLSKQWEFIKDCYEIRNKIVHSNAKLVSKYDLEVVPILKKYKSISYKKDNKRFEIIDKKILLDLNKHIAYVVRNSAKAMREEIHKRRKATEKI